ncbi:uncharacterized protein LOC132548079 [Ylistrum balloti]|uniref:uncharacterized protein LOC132548079 n=1 Tax=Ylistrum balloti TaxID=509963 RepID=UPI002905ECF8|nr:uncharacterized protein LOC132548079 [Ylistrum balloti]
MFLSRKGLWFSFSVLLIYTSIVCVNSTKQDNDAIGNAFGSLFKAILNVVRSQFEATKDFVPGLDTAGGSTNLTTQNAGVNDIGDQTNHDTKVGMKVDMKSKKIFFNDDVKHSTESPSIDEEALSPPTVMGDHGTTDESQDSATNVPGPEYQESHQDQTSDQRTGDESQIGSTTQSTQDNYQSSDTGDAFGNSKIPDVSFSGGKSLSSSDGLPGQVHGPDKWPFQPDVKDMLGVLGKEITEPVEVFGGKHEIDQAGFVLANNMTEISMPTNESSPSHTAVESTDSPNIQQPGQEAENGAPIQGTGQPNTLSDNVDNTAKESGGFDGENPLLHLQELQTGVEEEVWPIEQNVGDMIQTVETELVQHGMSSPAGKGQGQGHDYIGGLEPNGGPLTESNLSADKENVETTEQANGDDSDVKLETKPLVVSEGSDLDQNSHNTGGTKGTQKSDDSNTLLRLVNTI